MFLQVIIEQVLYCPEMMFKISRASGSLCHITLQLPPNCFWITFPLARSGSPHFILHGTMYSALTPLVTMLMSEWKMIKHKWNSNHMFSVIYLLGFFHSGKQFPCISYSDLHFLPPNLPHKYQRGGILPVSRQLSFNFSQYKMIVLIAAKQLLILISELVK